MTLDELKSQVAGISAIHPMKNEEIPGGTNREGQSVTINRPKLIYGHADIVPKEILCSEKVFAVYETTNGKYVAKWANHLHVCDTLEDTKPHLNRYELELLHHGVKK